MLDCKVAAGSAICSKHNILFFLIMERHSGALLVKNKCETALYEHVSDALKALADSRMTRIWLIMKTPMIKLMKK